MRCFAFGLDHEGDKLGEKSKSSLGRVSNPRAADVSKISPLSL